MMVSYAKQFSDSLNCAHDVVRGAVADSLPVLCHFVHFLIVGGMNVLYFLRNIWLRFILLIRLRIGGLVLSHQDGLVILILRLLNRLTLGLRRLCHLVL